MKPLSLDNFFGWIVGAGTIYVFWVLLNVLAGDGFRWYFFFFFWDFQFVFMILIHLIKER